MKNSCPKWKRPKEELGWCKSKCSLHVSCISAATFSSGTACGHGGHVHKEGVVGSPFNLTFTIGGKSRFSELGVGGYGKRLHTAQSKLSYWQTHCYFCLVEKFAQIFKTRLGIERLRYLAMLWEHELRTSLCWHLKPDNLELTFPQKRPSEYRAPSLVMSFRRWSGIRYRISWLSTDSRDSGQG